MSGTTPTDTPAVDRQPADRPLRYDDARGTYHTRCDETRDEPVSTPLVMAIASIRNTTPAALNPLHDVVDSDALNALVVHWYDRSADDVEGSISFTYSNCDVTVDGTGEIVIDPL